jgi:hypothetical protein
LILNQNKNKSTLAPASIGPFVIQQVHVNGTVTIICALMSLNKIIFIASAHIIIMEGESVVIEILSSPRVLPLVVLFSRSQI